MIPAAVKALQDEVQRLVAQLDALQAKCERQEELLREALQWCPRKPTYPPNGKKKQAVGNDWIDLGDRIEAELAGNCGVDGGPELRHVCVTLPLEAPEG